MWIDAIEIYISIMGKKIKGTMFCDMWKWYEIQISESRNKISLEYIHAH